MDKITEIHNSLIKHYAEKQQAELSWYAESRLKTPIEVPEALHPVLQDYREAMISMVRLSTESMLHAIAHVLAEREQSRQEPDPPKLT